MAYSSDVMVAEKNTIILIIAVVWSFPQTVLQYPSRNARTQERKHGLMFFFKRGIWLVLLSFHSKQILYIIVIDIAFCPSSYPAPEVRNGKV